MTINQATLRMMRSSEPYGTACLLFLFSFLFFVLFRIPVPLNVDTYIYARSIETFEGPIVHLGYYAIGAICHYLLQPIGITPLQTLGYISQFFGGVSVAGMYIFTFLLTENKPHSLLSAVILMFSGFFWLFSIHGEVYVPQLAFVLLSLICLLKMRPLLSSLFILVAISITPTSLLALIPAGYVMYMRRFSKQDLVVFAAPILLTSIAVMWWYGPRVIETFEKAIYSPTIFFDEFSYPRMAINVAYRLTYAYGRSFNVITLLAIFGFFALHRHDKKLWALMLSFFLPFLSYLLNLGLFSPDHLIITFIAVSFLGAYGMLAFLDRVKARYSIRLFLVPILLLVFAWISFELVINRQKIYASELERVIQALSKQPWNRAIMIADYSFGMSLWTLTHEEESRDLLEGRPRRFLERSDMTRQAALDRLGGPFWISFACIRDVAALPQLKSMIEGRPIYFVERIDWPIGCVQVFKNWLIELGLEKQEKDNGRLYKIGEYLAYKLGTDITIKELIESPLHPVYLLEASNNSTQ